MWPQVCPEAQKSLWWIAALEAQMAPRVKRPCLHECLHARITVRRVDLQLDSWCRACTRPWLRVRSQPSIIVFLGWLNPRFNGETTPGEAAK
jgi:hypothetical protein